MLPGEKQNFEFGRSMRKFSSALRRPSVLFDMVAIDHFLVGLYGECLSKWTMSSSYLHHSDACYSFPCIFTLPTSLSLSLSPSLSLSLPLSRSLYRSLCLSLFIVPSLSLSLSLVQFIIKYGGPSDKVWLMAHCHCGFGIFPHSLLIDLLISF